MMMMMMMMMMNEQGRPPEWGPIITISFFLKDTPSMPKKIQRRWNYLEVESCLVTIDEKGWHYQWQDLGKFLAISLVRSLFAMIF